MVAKPMIPCSVQSEVPNENRLAAQSTGLLEWWHRQWLGRFYYEQDVQSEGHVHDERTQR
jgi:hypothetical protein